MPDPQAWAERCHTASVGGAADQFGDVTEMIEPGYRSKGLQTTFKRGWEAAEAGQPKNSCPYYDKRTLRGGVTYSRMYMRAWCFGWNSYHRERRENPNMVTELKNDIVR
mgnify:CR=1 FL=1